jgi:hypothetical protein
VVLWKCAIAARSGLLRGLLRRECRFHRDSAAAVLRFWRWSVDRSESGRLGTPLFLLCIDGDKHRAPMKGITKAMNRNKNQKLVEECKKLLENGLLPFSIFLLGSALLIVIGVKLWL